MHQICLEELTIRVMELERQMRAVHLDAQTARSSRFAQIKEMQDLQARAAADERAAAADERSAVERIKTAQALNQCKVKQQQYRQLQISLHRELVANMQEQQQQLVQIHDQQQDLLDSNGLVQLQLEDMLLAQVLLKQQLFSEQTAAAATASADAAAQAAASVEGGRRRHRSRGAWRLFRPRRMRPHQSRGCRGSWRRGRPLWRRGKPTWKPASGASRSSMDAELQSRRCSRCRGRCTRCRRAGYGSRCSRRSMALTTLELGAARRIPQGGVWHRRRQ